MPVNSNPVICGALRDNGKTCQRICKPGFTKCYMHGGATPVAKVKAENALALLRIPVIEVTQNALETLNDMIDQFNEMPCAACGYPKGDTEEREAIIKACVGAIKTAQTILDRTGLGPRATLDIRTTHEDDVDLKLLTEDERGRMAALVAQFKALKAEAKQRMINGVTGVEVPQPPQVM